MLLCSTKYGRGTQLETTAQMQRPLLLPFVLLCYSVTSAMYLVNAVPRYINTPYVVCVNAVPKLLPYFVCKCKCKCKAMPKCQGPKDVCMHIYSIQDTHAPINKDSTPIAFPTDRTRQASLSRHSSR
jgi:hypothetical protein